MKRTTFSFLAMALLIAWACSSRQEDAGTPSAADSTTVQLPGDSTLYGLACDGCSDTIVVLLSRMDANPDTFDILEASRQHRVYGRPRVGDYVALVINSEDPAVADIVIDIEQLKGTWCYQVTPTLRQRAGMNTDEQQALSTRIPDSIRRRIMQPREYGFQLMPSSQVRPIGIQRDNNTGRGQSPVIWPKVKRYRRWHLLNGRLVLTEIRRDSLPAQSDTADFVALRRDTLILRFNTGEQKYYRKNKE